MQAPERARWASNVSDVSPAEDDSATRAQDDFGRDLELLLRRLAESREAIVRLLAATGVDDGAGVPELLRREETEILGPQPGEATVHLLATPAAHEETEPLKPRAAPVVTPRAPTGPFGIPGPAALELALIYRQIAQNGAEIQHGARPGAVPERPTGVPQPTGRAPGTVAVPMAPSTLSAAGNGARVVAQGGKDRGALDAAGKGLRMARPSVKAPGTARAAATGPRAARRRLLAVVLTAVGAVVLLTTLVSLLPTLVSVL